jgi:UDP-glucose 4-epimerase
VTATARSREAARWAQDALIGAKLALLPDAEDHGLVAQLIKEAQPSVVISCAGTMTAIGEEAIRTIIDGNVLTTATVLDASAVHHVARVLVFGSGFEYAPSDNPAHEESPMGPTTAYGAAKRAASDIVEYFRGSRSVEACVVRPFSLFGPRERIHRFVPHVITAALTDRPIEMSVGNQRRDYLFVDDLAAGVSLLTSFPGPLPPAVNFSGPSVHSLIDIANFAVTFTGSASPVRQGMRLGNPGDRQVFLGDSSLARDLLGWRASHSLESGLEATVDWYRDNSSLWRASA